MDYISLSLYTNNNNNDNNNNNIQQIVYIMLQSRLANSTV